MNYAEWRKDNEKKYTEMVDDGGLEEFPAFDPTTHTDELCERVGKIVDELIDDDQMTPIHFACVFTEYLFEKYHIDPEDAEIMGLYFSKGILAFMTESTSAAITNLFNGTSPDLSDEGGH